MSTIILDFETSGLNPYHDDIIEIGAKVLNKDASFQCLVKPKSNKLISEKITEITGIKSPNWDDLIPHFKNDCKKYTHLYKN